MKKQTKVMTKVKFRSYAAKFVKASMKQLRPKRKK